VKRKGRVAGEREKEEGYRRRSVGRRERAEKNESGYRLE
jgi:hypothetical protein